MFFNDFAIIIIIIIILILTITIIIIIIIIIGTIIKIKTNKLTIFKGRNSGG